MADKFRLSIVTPDREFFNEEAEMVEFNTTEGEMGVYAGHAPLTVIIKPGVLTITQGDSKKNAALHAGFIQILPEEITILAEIIEWPDEIDARRAEAAKQRAEERLAMRSTAIDVDRAQVALMKAVARMNAAGMK